MPAPTFNLPVIGTAPNQHATAQGLEQEMQRVLNALWDGKADAGAATPSYATRAAAETGAPGLPSAVVQILVREGSALVIRSRTASADDPLFSTGARWGAVLRIDVAAINNQATPSYATRAAALEAAAGLPAAVTQIFVREGNALVVRSRAAAATDPLYQTGARWGIVWRFDPEAAAQAAGGRAARPGEQPAAFGTGTAGAPAVLGDPLGAAAVSIGTVSGLGEALIVRNGALALSARAPIAVQPGRIYRLHIYARRLRNPVDPSGDTMRAAVQRLDASYASLGTVVVEDKALRAADGLWHAAATFSLAPSLGGVDHVLPAGTVYLRPFVQLFGSDHETAVLQIEIVDITEAAQIDGALDVLALAGAVEQAGASAASADGARLESEASRQLADSAAFLALAGTGAGFDSAQQMLASSVGYGANSITQNGQTVSLTVAAGNVWSVKGGFAYEVAPAGAVDHDATTSGGVKLYRLPSDAVFFVAPGGSDTATGLTPSSPFRTLAKAGAMAKPGDVVRLQRGGIWRETGIFPAGVVVEPYGSGLRPIISGQDVVASFTAVSGGPSYACTIEIDTSIVAQRGYPGFFEDGKRMREIKVGDTGISTAAAAQEAVRTTPGSFYFAGPGSHTGGWDAGVKTYHVHASDGGNPNTNGKLYEAYKRVRATQGGAHYRDIRLHCGWHHDGIQGTMDGGSIERLARHGNLPSVPQFKNVTVVGDNPAYGGGGFFHSNPSSLQADATYEGCTVVGEGLNGKGYYQHGQVGGEYRRIRTYLLNCAAYNVAEVATLQEVQHVIINGLHARNFASFISANAGGSTVMSKVDAKGGTGPGARFLPPTSSGLMVIRDSKIDFWAQQLFFNASAFGPIEVYDTDLILRASSVSGNISAVARPNNLPLQRLRLERCRLIFPGGVERFIEQATTANDVRVNDCLFVGGSGVCHVGGALTSLDALDPTGRRIFISREKAILRDDKAGLELRQGVYQPGDAIYSGIAHPGSSKQPRTFVAVGDRIMASSNSMDAWRLAATPTSHLNAVTLTDNAGAVAYVAVGDDGLIMRSDSAGTAWSVVGAGVTTKNLRAVWAMVGGTVVAVGADGVVLRSTDGGLTWAEVPSGTTRTLHGVASNRAGTQWVAAGAEGRVITSADGAIWTEATVGTQTWRSVYRAGQDVQFLLGGDGGELRSSVDGATWTARTSGTLNSIRGFAWNGGTDLIAIAQQTSAFIDTFLTSADNGATWTVEEASVPFEMRAIVGSHNPMFTASSTAPFGNMHTIAVGESQTMAMRHRRAWTVRRIGSNGAVDLAESMDRWLEGVQ